MGWRERDGVERESGGGAERERWVEREKEREMGGRDRVERERKRERWGERDGVERERARERERERWGGEREGRRLAQWLRRVVAGSGGVTVCLSGTTRVFCMSVCFPSDWVSADLPSCWLKLQRLKVAKKTIVRASILRPAVCISDAIKKLKMRPACVAKRIRHIMHEDKC